MWILYQAAVATALAASLPFLLLGRGGHYRSTLAARLGRRLPPGDDGRGGLWIHAVSVGEVGVATTLVRALPPELPMVVTTVTPTGQARARASLGDRATVAYLPFDLAPALDPFLHRFAPRALVLVEGDYWPLVLQRCRRRGVPVAVVNGRIGDRGYRRLLRLRPLARRFLYAPVGTYGVQSDDDRERLLRLGVEAPRITVTGNLKYESPEPRRNPELEAHLNRVAAGRPLLIAGSTMAGEDAAVAEAFVAAGGGARALLVAAPRHPERWDAAERTYADAGLRVLRRSRLGGDAGAGASPADVVLLDSLGELAGLYALARGTFIGGTLIPTGGHNPLEPARFGRAVAVGPSMHNFRAMAADFDRAGAWERVADAAELARVWARWLDEPQVAAALGTRAAALVDGNRGALGRTLALLAPLLAAADSRVLGNASG